MSENGPTTTATTAYGSVNGQVEVLAAGGLITRTAADGSLEVALVHRPKYGDWSLPKGKLEAGESFQEAAIREVEEETGMRCGLERELGQAIYVDAQGRPKTVRWWAMSVLGDDGFKPLHEVDERRWVTPEQAERMLVYEHDRELVREAVAQS